MWYKNMLFMVIVGILQVEGQRGISCRTPNGEYATCMTIYDCKNFLNVIRTRDPLQRKFLRESQSQCGYDSYPLVCCGKAINYTQTTVVGRVLGSGIQKNIQFMRNSLIPNRTSCGFQETYKIYGGEETALEEFPWMVLLQYTNSSGYRKWACGGTVISSRYILTAAHCVIGEVEQKVGRLSLVRLGEYNTKTEIDCKSPRNCNQRPVDAGIDQVIPHPGYDIDNYNRYNDIALIRLNRAVTYTNYIRPICLPEPNETALVGDQVHVAGWGKVSVTMDSSPVKLKVEIPIAEKVLCTRQFARANVILSDSQICAGGQQGRDSCSGDSGGPLMKKSESDTSQWYQEGIVSFGAECGTAGWPGIYTRVVDYLPWIHSTVRN